MGVVTHGIPREIVVSMAKLQGCTAFVETGTFQGGTTRWAATEFEVVHTIERSQELYEQYSPGLMENQNIHCHLGDSRIAMPGIVDQLGDRRAIYWLDGHWSGNETAGEGDECPVMDELRSLQSRPDDLILIDDARFFLSAPPEPHSADDWPTIAEVVQALPEAGGRHFVQVIDDVIFIVPNTVGLRKLLIDYGRATLKLQTRQSPQKSKLSTSIKRIGRRLTTRAS